MSCHPLKTNSICGCSKGSLEVSMTIQRAQSKLLSLPFFLFIFSLYRSVKNSECYLSTIYALSLTEQFFLTQNMITQIIFRIRFDTKTQSPDLNISVMTKKKKLKQCRHVVYMVIWVFFSFCHLGVHK